MDCSVCGSIGPVFQGKQIPQATQFGSRPLHMRIIGSTLQNYGVGSRRVFQTSVKLRSVFPERKYYLWFNYYGGY